MVQAGVVVHPPDSRLSSRSGSLRSFTMTGGEALSNTNEGNERWSRDYAQNNTGGQGCQKYFKTKRSQSCILCDKNLYMTKILSEKTKETKVNFE